MKTPITLAMLLACLLDCTALKGEMITTYVSSIEAPNGTPIPALPVFLSRDVKRVFVRFDVPDAANIASLSSFEVTIRIRDDDDSGDGCDCEDGGFAMPMSGLGTGPFPFGYFGPFPDADSAILTSFVDDPFLLGLILDEIKDNGRFAIRVDRFSGDFNVEDVSVAIDANNVPEPSSVVLVGCGSLFLVSRFRNRPAR